MTGRVADGQACADQRGAGTTDALQWLVGAGITAAGATTIEGQDRLSPNHPRRARAAGAFVCPAGACHVWLHGEPLPLRVAAVDDSESIG